MARQDESAVHIAWIRRHTHDPAKSAGPPFRSGYANARGEDVPRPGR